MYIKQFFLIYVLILSYASCKPEGRSVSPESSAGSVDTINQSTPDTIPFEAIQPALKVSLKIFHRRSGDMSVGPEVLTHDDDTLHFYKGQYNKFFRVYKMEYNRTDYAVKKVTLTGYQKNRKLYSSVLSHVSKGNTVEFMDEHVNVKEDRLKLEVVFLDQNSDTERKWTINVFLDKVWK